MLDKVERALILAERVTDKRAGEIVALLRDVVEELKWLKGTPVWKLDYSPHLFARGLDTTIEMTVRFKTGETRVCKVNPIPFLGTEMAMVGRGVV